MPKPKKTTAKTLHVHATLTAQRIIDIGKGSARDHALDLFNDFLDKLQDEDVFGTEGQLDPRGDHRA